MDHKQIRALLQATLEAEVPATSIHLWPAVKKRLAGQPTPSLQGVRLMPSVLSRRLPRIALATFALLALCAMLLVTPPGQSLAQRLTQFFAPAASTTLPLPLEPLPATAAAAEPTAPPPAPLITVAEAAAQVGFPVAQLASVPSGFTYLGARVYGSAVTVEYQTPDYSGHLILTQSRQGYVQSDWDAVPAEAVVPVHIGDLEGEFVQGTFVVYAEATAATWNPNAAILRLRWQKDGIYYALTKFGDSASIAYLDQAQLVVLAEALMQQP